MSKALAPTTEQVMKLAREQLVDEFVNNRSAVYTKWLVDAECAWKNGKELIPYTSFLKYPSEADIVYRAFTLNKSFEGIAMPIAAAGTSESTKEILITDDIDQVPGLQQESPPGPGSTVAVSEQNTVAEQPMSVLAKFKQMTSGWSTA